MPAKKAEKLPSFEQALEELEEMVDTMESGQLSLEELIASYERGAKLISHCDSVLGEARKRLDLITLTPRPNAEESTETQPDVSANNDTSPNTPNDDEIRLF